MKNAKAPQRPRPRTVPLDPLDPRRLKHEAPLVYELMKFIRSFVVMPRERLMAVALWVVHTHALDLADQTPYLSVTSPEKQCGKSRLLEVLELLVNEPWQAVVPSEAVVYRQIQAKQPTLLLDEVDTIFNPRSADKYEGLRALLNSGHRRGATVPRCVGTTNTIVKFSTFCPKVLAGIGTLPDTVADRSIPIRLERRTRDEPLQRLIAHKVEPVARKLRERVVAWVADNSASMVELHPPMPDELSDRMQDGCECLVVIADRMGCGVAARQTLVTLFTAERLDDAESLRIRLLRDVRTAFGDGDRLPTGELIAALCRDQEAPWATYYGRGIDARDVSSMLHPYGIGPTTIRAADKVCKGYKREDFHDAWLRYL